jgi:uncharacterized LabA/DUF88 family protein
MPDKITIQRRETHRVGIFVDVQNLYHSAKNLYHSRVNFAELFKVASADREVVRAVAYVVKSDTPEEKAFFDALEKSGFELKVKDLQIFAGGQKKADWDVGLAIDAISLSKQVDVVVIMSGDGDFIPLVEYLQFNGQIVEAMSFGRSTSGKLKEKVNNFIDLDEHRKVLMRIPARQAGGPAKRGAKPEANPENEGSL